MTDVPLIARSFRCARAEFEQLYDRLTVANGGQPFKFVALGAADDIRAFEQALREAEAQDWLWKFCMDALKAGFCAESDNEVRVELQALVNPHAGFIKAEVMGRGGVQAWCRVCSVLVDEGDTAQGTGFLTGPQTVMTAWHVVRALLDGNGQEIDGSESRLSIRFDAPVTNSSEPTMYGAVKGWLVSSSPCLPEEIPGTDGARLANGAADRSSHLDFAVIKLDGLPGRARGFYGVSNDLWLDEQESRMFVYQHPHNQNQRIDVASNIQYQDAPEKLRLIHNANTLPGSSGGLCVDKRFRAVALHQCALLNENDEHIGNGATPTAYMAPSIGDVLSADSSLERVLELANDGHPVVGRHELQRSIWEMVEGVRRILQVRGPAKSGKSFTKKILKTALPSDEHVFVEMSAGHLPVDELGIAGAILSRVEAQGGVATPLPRPEDSDSADAAWRSDHLLPAFERRLTAAAGDRLMWFVLDDIEHHTLPDAGGRRFLELLYGRVRAIPSLRIVLLGLDGLVPAAVPEDVVEDTTGSASEKDLEAYLTHWYGRKQWLVSADEVSRMSKIIHRSARAAGGDFMPALAQILRNIVVPALSLREDQ